MVKKICEICHEEFDVENYRKNIAKYCSNACYFKARWPIDGKIVNRCKQCGKDIITFKSDNKVFCCLECRKNWMSQNMRNKNHPRYKGRIKYNNKYYGILAPYHPFADSKGYVYEHRLVMEKYLERFLDKDEVVHHINRDVSDNRIENLELMLNSTHGKMHMLDYWNNKNHIKES